jgi:hypothetical protein
VKKIVALLFLLTIIFPEFIQAQCAMCKAVVETGKDKELIEGVNNGILYMMGVPYLLMMVVGIAWYNKYMRPEKKT